MATAVYTRYLTHGQQMALGVSGVTLINDTNANTGKWWAVVPLADTVFTTLTDDQRDGDSIVGQTFPAGVFIPGEITAITLASGSVLAYKRPLIAGE
jgi:hypothetical protein